MDEEETLPESPSERVSEKNDVAETPVEPSPDVSPPPAPLDAAPPPRRSSPTRRRIVDYFAPPRDESPYWWIRHRRKLALLEWLIILVFVGVALYFLWLILFPAAPAAPTLEEFRERLGARPPLAPSSDWEPEELSDRWKKIAIHHSATAGGSLAAIDRNHREKRKWENGFGYHFLIGNGVGRGTADGVVEVGERWKKQMHGAHVGKGRDDKDKPNEYSVGIVVVGDFTQTVPTEKQLASLRGLLLFLERECGLTDADIGGHKDFPRNDTLCPGTYLPVREVIAQLARDRVNHPPTSYGFPWLRLFLALAVFGAITAGLVCLIRFNLRRARHRPVGVAEGAHHA